MPDNIVADTSFYISCECDAKKREWLDYFLDNYSFHMGIKIFKELPESLASSGYIDSRVKICDGDFFEIVKPFFGRSEKHKNDGEYEAIGIAYHLNTYSTLLNLIIDEKRATNFVTRHFPALTPKLIKTIQFIYNSKINNYLSKEPTQPK